MNPPRPGPTSAPEGGPSDARIQLESAIRLQDNGLPPLATGLEACERALTLLENLQAHQATLPRGAAQAWERAAFCGVFDHPEPGHRIRRFLDKG